MVRPNYKDFRRSQFVLGSGQHLEHSAKGSTWEDHKYIKRVDGTYYYPDSYEGGRHLPEGEKKDSEKDEGTKVFDEFETFSKALMAKGEAYWDDKEVAKMSKEELGDLYENMTGVKLGQKDLDRLFNSREARNKPKTDEAEKTEKTGKTEKKESKTDLSDNDVEKLANEVVRGNFGNGQTRKDLLGDNYEKIQKRVNEIMKSKGKSGSSVGSKKVKEATSETINKAKEVAKKVSGSSSKSKVHSGVNLDEVQSVYKKKKKK